jgi:hypothetical protein
MAEPEISKSNMAKKICLLGDFGVGKTSLIRHFVDRQFSQDYLSTVGVQISRKLVEFGAEEGEKKNNFNWLSGTWKVVQSFSQLPPLMCKVPKEQSWLPISIARKLSLTLSNICPW